MSAKKRRRMEVKDWHMGIDIGNGRDRTAFTLGYWDHGVFKITAVGSFEGDGGIDLAPAGLPLKLSFSTPRLDAGGPES